jgi:[NiFe] hydrogenase assembly HybE family chaperone
VGVHLAALASSLLSAFQHIAATRMAGVALVNPALSVETVDFRDWNGDAVGVLITPWCMNLICLPGQEAEWTAWGSGTRHDLALPGGDYEFLTAEEEAVGPYLSASLFSPMFEFTDMDQAREVARAVLAEVFKPVPAPLAPEPSTPEPPPSIQERLEQPVSRRGFLGALLGGRP